MKQKFCSVRGTTDFYPPETFLIKNILKKADALLEIFGYEFLLLSHLEDQGLFQKGVGSATDIVERQMFKIESKDVVLRPEGTAQVARFYIQNSLHKQKDFHKFYYTGSMFRGERPQKGRLREFNHIGVEAVGSDSFYLDAEMIMLGVKLISLAGVVDFKLKLNSLGCLKDKEKLSKILTDKLSSLKAEFCPDCERRFDRNPLRILDCKNRNCKKIVSLLKISDSHLCGECKDHFLRLRSLLDELKIAYDYDPFLMRGLDYYTNTVFEFTSSDLGAQDAIGAGGRYNNLISNLGGPQTPAIGFALGLERILLVTRAKRKRDFKRVFVATTSDELYDQAYKITLSLRESGISTEIDYRKKSLKAQLRVAQKNEFSFVIIVGEDELKEGCVILRNMRESIQEKIDINNITSILKERIDAEN